jgi:hypothetical protein
VNRRYIAPVALVGCTAGLVYGMVGSLQQSQLPARHWVVVLIWLVSLGLALHKPSSALYALLIATPFYSYLRREYLFRVPPAGDASSYLDPIHAIPDLLLLLSLMVALYGQTKPESLARGIEYSKIRKPLLAFVVIAALQVMNPFLPSAWKGINGFREQAFFMLVFYVASRVLRSRHDLRRVAGIALLTSVVAALYAIKQSVYGFTESEWAWARSFYSLHTSGSVYRVFSTMNSAGHLGDLMMVGLLLSVAYAKLDPRVHSKMLSVLCAPLVAVAMVLTFVRSTWFGAIAGLCFLFFVSGASTGAVRRKRALVLMLLAVSVTVMQGGESNRASQEPSRVELIDVVRQRGYEMRAPFQVQSFQGRMDQFRVAVPWIVTHPFGAGIEPMGKYDRSYGPVVESYILATGVQLGWLGLVALLYLYWTVFRCGFAVLDRLVDPDLKWWCRVTLSLFVGAIVASAAGPHPSVHPLDLYLWTMAGTISLLPLLDSSGGYREGHHTPDEPLQVGSAIG